ncbi:hypothetical protein HZS_5036 [Henneguya salminicola]|nr:hypothetical protein HZS_5036 [Henneguya salminicola]
MFNEKGGIIRNSFILGVMSRKSEIIFKKRKKSNFEFKRLFFDDMDPQKDDVSTKLKNNPLNQNCKIEQDRKNSKNIKIKNRLPTPY